MINEKRPHRFFDRILDNDLNDLHDYLTAKQEELLSGDLVDIEPEILAKFNVNNGPSTQLGSRYNIFDFEHAGIRKLADGVRQATVEACDYYEIDFDSMDYRIHGWFNLDHKTEGGTGVNPIKNENFFHDHMGGEGAPLFHGYYCVNAEPSTTYYKIDGETLFENHNVNNRLIVSETGHPHGRDDWFEDKSRITIAYDIAPFELDGKGDKWRVL